MALTEGTPTWDRLVAGEGFQRDLFTKVVARFPFGRAPSADEVAAVAVFLASDTGWAMPG
jgi:3-oxoacyl-[acyl-carrier protein] reductase